MKVIPRSEFLAKAKPICERGTGKIDWRYRQVIPRALRQPNSEEALNKATEKFVIPTRIKELKELRALGLPRGSEKKLETFYAAMEEGIEKGRRDPSTLRSGGPFAFQRAFNMAGELGLGPCFLG